MSRNNIEHSKAHQIEVQSGRFGVDQVTLSGDYVLPASAPVVLAFDAGGSDRIVQMQKVMAAGDDFTSSRSPAGRFHIITNVGNVGRLNVTRSDLSNVCYIEPLSSALLFAVPGVGWRALGGSFNYEGTNHRGGFVPDPGPTAVGVRVLREDGWGTLEDVTYANGFMYLSDGTNVATATGADTLRFRSSDGSIVPVVGNNDVTYGDNVNLTVNEAAVDHNQLLNYVADQHVDHSGVSINAGVGLTGGGNILNSRTLDWDPTKPTTATPALADTFAFYNVGATGVRKSTLSGINAVLDHNALTNYVASRHIDHNAVSIVAGIGLSGGGTIDATRSLSLDIHGMTAENPALEDELAIYDASGGDHNKITLSQLATLLDPGVAGVLSFNGRTGPVVPVSGDYTAAMVGALDITGGTLTGNLNLNKNTAGLAPAINTGEIGQFQQADGLANNFRLVAFQAGVNFIGTRAEGTGASPANTAASVNLGAVGGGGYDTTNGWKVNGSIGIFSDTAWSDTNHHTKVRISLTPSGATSQVPTYELYADGASFGPTAYALGNPGFEIVQAKNLSGLDSVRIGRGGSGGYLYMRDNANTAYLPALGFNTSDGFLYVYSRGSGLAFQSAANSTVARLYDNGGWNVKDLVGESLAARDWGATAGYIRLAYADATHTGYIEWYKAAGTRLAYMGYDNANITLNLENSAKFQVLGGATEFIGTTFGVAAKVRNGYLQLDGSSPGIFFTSPDGTSNWTCFHKSDYTWNFTFNGGSEYFKLKAGNQLGLGFGAAPEFGYQGALITSKPAASSQHINMIRSGQYVWSLGYEYNQNNFAIGGGSTTDIGFVPAFKLSAATGAMTAAIRGGLTGEANVDVATAVYEPWVSLSRFSAQSNPMQAALDALSSTVGGSIFIPPGIWTIPAQCSKYLDGGTVNLVGSGMGISVLRWNSSSAGIILQHAATTTNPYKEAPQVRDISFITAYTSGGCGPALRFQFDRVETNGSQGPIIQNCQFFPESVGTAAYWYVGIDLVNARQTQIMNCNFRGYPQTWNVTALGYGIRTRGWTVQTNVKDCNFTEMATGQYYGGMSEGVFINGCAHVNCNFATYMDGGEADVIGSSTTSNTIGTGSKTFTLAVWKDYWPGMTLFFKNGSNWMQGTVTSFDWGTLALVVNMFATSGSGTFASWTIQPDHPISDIVIDDSHANCWTTGFYFRWCAFLLVHHNQMQQGNFGAGVSTYCDIQIDGNCILGHIDHNIFTDTHYGTTIGISIQGVSTNDHIRVDTNWFRDRTVGTWLHAGCGANCTVANSLNAGGVTNLTLTT